MRKLTLLYAIGVILVNSCNVLKLPPSTTRVIVRETQSHELIPEARVRILKGNQQIGPELTTNSVGYVEFEWKSLGVEKPGHNTKPEYYLEVSKEKAAGDTMMYDQVRLQINYYLHYYDVFLSRVTENGRKPDPAFVPDSQRVADMHYHVSFRIQNRFGHELYKTEHPHFPQNLNWYTEYRNLCILHEGKWEKFKLHKIDFQNDSWKEQESRIRTLLNRKWVRPQKHNNSLKQYAQATWPHLKEGNVFLAFNSLTPIEHSVSDTGPKRLVNSGKTKAQTEWLKMIGWNKKIEGQLTHWENFNNEFRMMNEQAKDLNNFNWRFYEPHINLEESVPTILNVVEGAHILQHRFFPHKVGYDLDNRLPKETQGLLNDIKLQLEIASEDPHEQDREQLQEFQRRIAELEEKIEQEGNPSASTNAANPVRKIGSNPKPQKKAAVSSRKKTPTDSEEELSKLVDEVLHYELRKNIDSLKKLRPTVHMVTIGHLTYNGLLGHAPGLDDGKFPTKLIARKVYGIRVSEDRSYEKQWKSVFFLIPGPNQFGKAVIDNLVSEQNGHRILIDLKHSDYPTRKYFYDEVVAREVREEVILKKGTIIFEGEFESETLQTPTTVQGGTMLLKEDMGNTDMAARPFEYNRYNTAFRVEKDTMVPIGTRVIRNLENGKLILKDVVVRDTTFLPPICSHCGVTGLPSVYNSPFNDEYSLRRAPSTNTFYPFGINLYDDEIGIICKNGGIIGIPLEQRVLGGYIDRRVFRRVPKWKNGKREISLKKRKRWKHIRKLFCTYYDIRNEQADSLHTQALLGALDYTRNVMGVPPDSLLERNRGRAGQFDGNERILKVTIEDYISAEPFLQNLFHIIDRTGDTGPEAWKHVCIGSDLDGMIDPLDICPTAGQYPEFRARLRQFIPIFLKFRKLSDESHRAYEEYFDEDFTPNQALTWLFYKSLQQFSTRNFGK